MGTDCQAGLAEANKAVDTASAPRMFHAIEITP